MSSISKIFFLSCVIFAVTISGFTSTATNILDEATCQFSSSESVVMMVATPTDLFISQYMEGGSNNKYIEIFNGTGSTVDMADYELRHYNNGSPTITYNASLSGTLTDGDVIIYANGNAALLFGPTVSLAGSVMTFNGDDALVLYNVADSQIVDIFGSIGEDPGSFWSSGSHRTQNRTLERKSFVMSGVTNDQTTGFPTLESEWNLYLQDDTTGFGSHTIDGPPGSLSAVCTDPTLYLDTNGDITVTVEDIDGGSTADSLVIVDSVFSCADIGMQDIMLIAYDSLGNADTCIASVTIADSLAPVAMCANITVYLDGAGNFALDSNTLENGSTDNCGIESVEASPTILTLQSVPIAGLQDLFFSEYVEGNSNNKYMEVYNGTGATVDLSNYEIIRSNNGGTSSFGNRLSGMLADGEVIVYGNSSAAVYLDSVTELSTMAFNGDDAMILYNLSKGRIADIFGVIGDDPGSAWTASGGYSTQNKTLVRRSNVGHGVLSNPSGTGPTAFGTLASQWDVFDIDDVSHLGMHSQNAMIPTYVLANNIVTDTSGNIGTCESQVTLIDTFNIAAVSCNDTVLYLDGDGMLFVDAVALTSAHSGVILELDNAIFTCGELGTNSVQVTATGADGMTETCTAMLTVADTTSPFALCADTILYLDMSGNAMLDAASLDGGSGDNCGVDSFHITQSAFDTSDVGVNAIVLTVFDASGNMDSCVSTVTVVDTFSLPFVSCQDITIYLDGAGLVSITASDVDNGSTGSIAIDSMNFDCSELGNNVVVLTATNTAGSDTCHAIVTVADSTAPITSCMDITVYLDSTGMATIDSNALDAGSTDNCGVESINVSQSTFTLADLSSGSINDLFFSEYYEDGGQKYLEVYNGTGDSVNLSDYAIRRYTNGASSPSSSSSLSGFIQHGEVMVYRASGSTYYKGATISLPAITFNGDDAMELYNTTLGEAVDIFGNIGEDPGTSWTDGAHSTEDVDLRRKVSVKQGVTIDPTGSGFPTLASEWDLFPEADTSGLGMHTADTSEGIAVTQTTTDASGNESTCTSNVIVLDTFNISVLAACMDDTVYLDENGEVLVTLAQVDAGSIGDTIFITQAFFTCSDIGVVPLLLIAQDTAGTADTCEFNLTIMDTLAPMPVCQDVTVYLDENGMASIDSSHINNGSTDNCGIVSITLSQTAFTYADTGVGPPRFPTDLFISEYVEGSGNNKYIEIYNGTGAPVNLSDYELQLFGNGSPTPTQTEALTGTLNSGETKVYANSGATIYGGASTPTSVTFFNGNDALALYKISSTAFVDIFGNIDDDPGSSWIAAGGLSTLNMTSRRKAAALDGVTNDPTGGGETSFETYFDNWIGLAEDDVSGLGSHTIDTSGINGVAVTMTVTDASGNVDSCSALVTVINLVATAVCADTSVYLDGSGNFVVTVDLIDGGSVGDTVFVLDGMVDCSDLGMTMVSLVALDDDGASDTCQATVMVLDTVSPTPSCQNITVYYDASGIIILDSNAIDNMSTDNCAVASFSLSESSFSCGTPAAPISNDLFISEYVEGTLNTTRYLEIYNGTGASVDLSDYQIKRYTGGSTFSATSTLSGILANGAVIVYMHPSGDSSLYAGVPLNSVMTFNGDDAVELYKISTASSVDIFGRIGDDPGAAWTGVGGYTTVNSTLAKKSTILDGVSVNPTGTGPGAFVTLTTEWDLHPVNYVGGLGTHDVAAATVTNVTVTQTVFDASGNSASCAAVVTIADSTAPVIVTQDITITLDGTGNAMIEASDIDAGTDDNCSLDTLTIDISSFDCSNAGDNTVTLTATDASGNISQGTANVHVLVTPLAVVYIDSSASGANNGSTWAHAFNNLADALANPCYLAVDTIYMAAGTYLPNGADRSASFEFANNTVVLGGYAAGGTSRDVSANQTILCGDAGTIGDQSDNLYHVVHITGSNLGVQLDGLTIACGNADGGGLDNEGAGILCEGEASLNTVTISDNQSTGAGSAISATGSNVDLHVTGSLITNSNSGAIRISVDASAAFLMEDSEIEED